MLYWVVKKRRGGERSTNNIETSQCVSPLKPENVGRFVRNIGCRFPVECGFHNHKLMEILLGYSYASRLSSEKKTMVNQLTKNMVKSGQMLLTIKDQNQTNLNTIKIIYNEHQRYCLQEKGLRMEIQHLIKLIERDQYVYWFRWLDNEDVVGDIMWPHPNSIKLLNSFSIVLICDTTYKTNKYRLSLLEIVGITSTSMTFVVAFAYLITWKGLFVKNNVLSQVIVNDSDITFMNALEIGFHSLTNLLCLFYITKNSPDEVAYNAHFKNFSTRVEGAHVRLKRLLHDSIEESCSCWDVMNNMFVSQHTSVKASFQKSINMVEHSSTYGCTLRITHRLPCAYELIEFISAYGYILLKNIHVHWKILSIRSSYDTSDSWGNLTLTREIDALFKRFSQLDVPGKIILKTKVRELAF
ncbi:hypothetical protein GmHk_13G037446 [Glycine max]|nr:hypothetical protein GmHk_13G037446 [Glycine max]